MLEANGIVIGAIIADADVTDTCNAYIYKQNPERFDDEKKFSISVPAKRWMYGCSWKNQRKTLQHNDILPNLINIIN